MPSQPIHQCPLLMEQETVSYILSEFTQSSVRAQVVYVCSRRDVSVGVGLKGGGEILLVIGVVHAILGPVFLNAVHGAVGGERQDVGGPDLVEVLGFAAAVLKAVQVLGLRVVGRDGGEGGARRTRVMVVWIHHVRNSVLVHVVCKRDTDISKGTGQFLIKCVYRA